MFPRTLPFHVAIKFERLSVNIQNFMKLNLFWENAILFQTQVADKIDVRLYCVDILMYK